MRPILTRPLHIQRLDGAQIEQYVMTISSEGTLESVTRTVFDLNGR